ncbi:MAG TPA: hypothetical protein VF017_08205 [Thermoanaerobaculia bacterium]|nr:hypothetical protein [Thermoanaerobaculia bacterium]
MSKPNYSGRWRFCAEASTLQIAIPDAVVFAIEHREPSFHLERTLTFGGLSNTFALDLTVGTEREPLIRGDATLYPSLRWEGDQLVFRTRIVQGDDESTNVVRYALEEEGTVLVAEESFRGPKQNYSNRWVFRADVP